MSSSHSPNDVLETFLGSDTRWTASVIRDLLVHARRPDVISLAGGLPAPELLATERLADASTRTLDHRGRVALQYGLTAGEPELREVLGASENAHPDDLIITAGSQQALDLLVRTTTRPGDRAVIEDPGYLGAVQILRSHQLELIAVPVDAQGLRTDVLAELLAAGLRPRVCYVNPTHQNPTGALLSAERADLLMELAERYGFMIIVDDPYVEIGFDQVPSLTDLSPRRSPMVARLGSMSKTLSPGLRIGWLEARAPLVERTVMAKQGADLHTSTINQLIVADVLSDRPWWDDHLDGLRRAYAARRQALLDAVRLHLPTAQVRDQHGGFFLWVTLPGGIDTTGLLPVAVEAGVAYVPGSAFAIAGDQGATIRLSYSLGDPTQFGEGLRRLGAVLEASSGNTTETLPPGPGTMEMLPS